MKISIFTAPRSGTHFLTRSISKSLNLPYDVPISLAAAFPKGESWVVGGHSPFSKKLKEELKRRDVKTLVIKRDPLDAFLAHAAFAQFEWLPNDERTFTSSFAEAFAVFLKDNAAWQKNVDLVLDYEVLSDSSHKDFTKQKSSLETLVGGSITFESVQETRENSLVGDHGTVARGGVWKEVLTKNSIVNLCNTLGIDSSNYLNEKSYVLSEDGDAAHRSLYAPLFELPPLDERLLAAGKRRNTVTNLKNKSS